MRTGTGWVFGPAVALAVSTALPGVSAAAGGGYSFEAVVYLGDSVDGDALVNDFEPGAISSSGDIAFGTDVSGGEAVYLRRHGGPITRVGRTDGAAPGGGTYEFGFLGPVALNDEGDMLFDFLLKDFALPVGANAGTYVRRHSTGEVTPVVIPYVTPVPGGGTFLGVSFTPTINNRGDMYFNGLIETEDGVHAAGEPYGGVGFGLFKANRGGRIVSIVGPGDPAPGGGTFDFIWEAWANDGGDVAFGAHEAGEPTDVEGFPPQEVIIHGITSLYAMKGATGAIQSVVHSGDPAPGGGSFRQAFHPMINSRGNIAFNGDVTAAPGSNEIIGVFARIGGKIVDVARPGDPLPGGGTLATASNIGGNLHINNRDEIVFNGRVDTGDDPVQTGLFRWNKGTLSVVVRSGTVIPGVGTVAQLTAPVLTFPPSPVLVPNSGALNNDRGQVFFAATLTDGRGVLLVATPK